MASTALVCGVEFDKVVGITPSSTLERYFKCAEGQGVLVPVSSVSTTVAAGAGHPISSLCFRRDAALCTTAPSLSVAATTCAGSARYMPRHRKVGLVLAALITWMVLLNGGQEEDTPPRHAA